MVYTNSLYINSNKIIYVYRYMKWHSKTILYNFERYSTYFYNVAKYDFYCWAIFYDMSGCVLDDDKFFHFSYIYLRNP